MEMNNLEIVEAAGKYWLYDKEKGPKELLRPIPVNGMGADIINMIKNNRNKDEIIRELCEQYGIDAECAQEDVETFLDAIDKVGYHSELSEI